mmetsp:Transcript_21833/g.36964  ORF Transcript_21833/g.36964 Transcript_21833/m.36964 type:complete len:822 (+) Transcript_21833:80-2545(+)
MSRSGNSKELADEVLAQQRKKKKKVKQRAHFLTSPSRVPGPGRVSAETMKVLRWSPFDGLPSRWLPHEMEVQTQKPDRPRSATPQRMKRSPAAHNHSFPARWADDAARLPPPKGAYTQPLQGVPFAGTPPWMAPPVVDMAALPVGSYGFHAAHLMAAPEAAPLPTLQRTAATPPVPHQPQALLDPDPYSEAERERARLEEERRLKAAREEEASVARAKAAERRLEEFRQRQQKEMEQQRRQELHWIWMKKLHAAETEAELEHQDVLVEERRARDRLEDMFKRGESNVYFTLQERIVQRQEDERNLKQSFIIQKEQELQHILRYNKLVMEEDAKRSNVEVYEQGEWALLLKQLRAWMVQWNAMQQAISLVVQEEELRRQKLVHAEDQEVRLVLREHYLVLEEEGRLERIEQAEFLQVLMDLDAMCMGVRDDIAAEEKRELLMIGEVFTHDIEYFILGLQQLREVEEAAKFQAMWEVDMEERAQCLLMDHEERYNLTEDQERRERLQIEELFFQHGEEIAFSSFLDLFDICEDEEEARRPQLEEEEAHQRFLISRQIVVSVQVSSAEATAREDVFEAEASAREQLKMMETLGRRMEEGILREQFQQQRLERLEQLDHAIGMALIKQHTQYNLTKSVTLVQAHARAYLSGKRTELKHVERYFRGAKTQLASTPLASNPLRRRSSAPRSASEPVHVLWPHEQPHTPYQQHFVMPLEQGPTTGLYQPSHEQSPSGAMYFDANRPYHASQPLQPLVLMPYYSNPGDRPRAHSLDGAALYPAPAAVQPTMSPPNFSYMSQSTQAGAPISVTAQVQATPGYSYTTAGVR